MSTTNQKDDAVISFVKAYHLRTQSDIAKMFLYADPSANSYDENKPETYDSLRTRCMAMNIKPEEPFDYTGMEKSLASVSIAVRIRHILSVLWQLRTIAEALRLTHHVKAAKGEAWPVGLDGKPLDTGRFPAFKSSVVRAMISAIGNAQTHELPMFIDEVYKAKYRNSGSYSYSLAETKLYTIKPDFLYASLNWIGSLPEMKGARDQAILVDPSGRTTRQHLVWAEWYRYSYNPKDQKHKFADTYEKLASAVCARIGKLKYEQPPSNATEEERNLFASQRASCEELMNYLGFDRSQFFEKKADGSQPDVRGIPDAKKKIFQTKLYEFLLQKLQAAHDSASTTTGQSIPHDDKEVPSLEYKASVINTMGNTIGIIDRFAAAVGIEKSLVYLDMLEIINSKPAFTRGDFETILSVFQNNGLCNDRLMNAVTKFISCTSQKESPSSRKKIPLEIEATIVKHKDVLNKLKVTEVIDPAIVFSRPALEYMYGVEPDVAARFAPLKDKTYPDQATGYLQRGVMALTSALKVNDVPNLPAGVSADAARYLANMLDEMASLYQGLIDPVVAQRKKDVQSNTRLAKKYQKLIGSQMIGASSPSYQAAPSQPYVAGASSPSAYNALPGSSVPVPAQDLPRSYEGMSHAAGHAESQPHNMVAQQLPAPESVKVENAFAQPPAGFGGFPQGGLSPSKQGGFPQGGLSPSKQGGFPQGVLSPPKQGGFSQGVLSPPKQGGFPGLVPVANGGAGSFGEPPVNLFGSGGF